MTKIETAIDDWYCGNDAILTIPERCALAEVVERLIAERTEQCAKIAEQGIDRMVKLRDTKPPMSEAWKVDNEGIVVKRIIASTIRALNTETKP